MPPPSEHSELPSKKTRLVISSGDRDLSPYPSPSMYTLNFDEPFVDVVSLTLLSASIPLVAYEVSRYNNTMSFSTASEAFDIIIPVGDYASPQEFASTVADLMNDVIGTEGTFTVLHVARSDSYTFSSRVPFSLLFDGSDIENVESIKYPMNTSARILGFGPMNYASQSKGILHVIQSEFRRDVSHTQTAIISIDGADVNVSPNQPFNRSYAIIGPAQYLLESSLPDRVMNKNFNPPMGKLARMRISITDIFGNPYDFQNRDHRLEFLVTCTPKYQYRPTWTVRAD